MMQAYSLCEKVLHAMKSGIMLKILSMAFAFLIVALVLLFGVGGEICSYQVALYRFSGLFRRLYNKAVCNQKLSLIWSYIVLTGC